MDAFEDSFQEDFFSDGSARRIDRPMFCEKCGYNLRSLPCAGRCTECGNHYNTRGVHLEGILIPQSVRFPSSDLFSFLLLMGIAGCMFYYFYTRNNHLLLALAALFGVLGAIQSWFLWRDMVKFIHCRRLVRQIRAQRNC